jgi:hypothetical protein
MNKTNNSIDNLDMTLSDTERYTKKNFVCTRGTVPQGENCVEYYNWKDEQFKSKPVKKSRMHRIRIGLAMLTVGTMVYFSNGGPGMTDFNDYISNKQSECNQKENPENHIQNYQSKTSGTIIYYKSGIDSRNSNVHAKDNTRIANSKVKYYDF